MLASEHGRNTGYYTELSGLLVIILIRWELINISAIRDLCCKARCTVGLAEVPSSGMACCTQDGCRMLCSISHAWVLWQPQKRTKNPSAKEAERAQSSPFAKGKRLQCANTPVPARQSQMNHDRLMLFWVTCFGQV